MFSHIVIFLIIIGLFVHNVDCSLFEYLIDPMNIFTPNSELNINEIRNEIIEEINYKKQQEEKAKYKTILEHEEKLKKELTQKMKENIIKQIEIENENKKFVQYLEIVKKNNRKEIGENIEENIIQFAEDKLNLKN